MTLNFKSGLGLIGAVVALLIMMFLLGKCSGGNRAAAAEAAKKAAEDSMTTSQAQNVGAIITLQREKTRDSTKAYAKVDSVILVQQVQRVSFSQQTTGIKQQLSSLTAQLYNNPGDTAESRRQLLELQNKLASAGSTINQIQVTSDQKDSLRVDYTHLLESIIDSTNRHADTLNRNFIGMQGLYAQCALNSQPHTILSAGFTVYTGGGLSGVGPALQLQAKNGSAYQVSVSYTTQKSGLVQFTWLSKISLKKH